MILKSSMICLSLLAIIVQAGSLSAKDGPTKDSQIRPPYATQNLVQYANPLCGTAGKGFTYPGAVAPFGMIHWSPDTGPGIRKGGYSYVDSIVYGFSLDHMSGAGCTYAENFAFTPLLGADQVKVPIDRTSFPTSFSHEREIARPGYYAVTLNNGIKVEITAQTRSGFGRFTYPAGSKPTMVINAGSNVRGTLMSSITIDPLKRSISGSTTGGHFCNHQDITTVYFYAVFDRPFVGYGVWSGDSLVLGGKNGTGASSGAFVTLDTSQGTAVLVRVGISYVSANNAKANLESEIPDSPALDSFDSTIQSASNTWNVWLNKIQVSGGTTEDLQTFYSMMYHTLLAPTVCSDVNGEYRGYDGAVHTAAKGCVQYANFSGWDIYRSECQFLAMIAPEEASDMAQSLLVDFQQGGAFPRWGVPNEDSGVMIGDPSAPIIAGFHAFGAREFDVKIALAGLVRAATDPTLKALRNNIYERPALAEYLKLGYVPQLPSTREGSVSMTLEYASADFAVSQLAYAVGDSTTGALLMKNAGNWRNLYNPETGFLQMRRPDGTWTPGFADSLPVYDGIRGFTEGTPSQYVWMVPFDLAGLARMMGGTDIAAQRLDTFFTKLNGGFGSRYCYLGNEPCQQAPWIYDFLGRPYKTQEIVRRAMTELFSSGPLGLPGNDDLGQTSSWYVWGALGMYPELPGSDVLVLGSPLFTKAVLHLAGGEVTIIGKGAGRNAPFVQRLSVDSRTWNKPWLRFRDITNGCELVYDLNSSPAPSWGSGPANAPPSYSGVKK
jgi:predicted alpha-1,2-mannosidase